MNDRYSLSSPKQVLIAANPKSGAGPGGQRVSALREALLSCGFECEVEQSLSQLRQRALTGDAAGQLKAVVSAGGDGTAEALANLLPAHIPLLLFPMGTENLLAKYLGISGDVRQACDILRGGREKSMDVGSANGKFFLVMLSCGFDAEVVRQMHATRTGHINRWSYARPICASLRSYRFPRLAWTPQAAEHIAGASASFLPSDRRVEEEHRGVAWLFVFNVPRYAAALDFCPQADPTDGLLDVCTFERPGILSGIGYLARLWLGSHQSMRGFSHTRCSRLEIPAPIGDNGETLDIPFQIDGDPGGVLPLSIETLPDRLKLLVPEAHVR
jgi:diacylglycerol kinase (ATP)